MAQSQTEHNLSYDIRRVDGWQRRSMTGKLPGLDVRLASARSIDITRAIAFKFNGRRYNGYAGDTLASALLANQVSIIGRSFKYHRPRGIYTAGPEEPNALVELRTGSRAEPNVPATTTELFDGLEARSQNSWPTLQFDLLAINGWFAPLIPAGFYYKTFKWPKALWHPVYEKLIRRAAGIGRVNLNPDPDQYEKNYCHCDVLVVGGGPAGLSAALAAARSGAQVMLADQNREFGGSLLRDRRTINGSSAGDWSKKVLEELESMRNVRLLRRTTIFGYYDHNMLGGLERVTDHLLLSPSGLPRQRQWQIRAKQVVIAAGAIERSIPFSNNDLPGIMLAAAVRHYVNRYGVRVGSRVAIFTNNDDAYRTAIDLNAAGIRVETLIDCRANHRSELTTQVEELGIKRLQDSVVFRAIGSRGIRAVEVGDVTGGGNKSRIDCDLLAVSGGWDPCVHLHCQSGSKAEYDESKAIFIPGPSVQASQSVGSAAGEFSLRSCIEDGYAVGLRATKDIGLSSKCSQSYSAVTDDSSPDKITPIWRVSTEAYSYKKQFVDLQGDVTTSDIDLAVREGYRSVEHLKRYTTQGMWTDQGKSSNINSIGILAAERRDDIAKVGTTHFRPPFTPVSISALAGPFIGLEARPILTTPLHAWHAAKGAVMTNTGQWVRASHYPHKGESYDDTLARETSGVRRSVGICDTSTLGKFSITGPDSTEFLNRLYCNGWNTLAPGKARFGIMLREDGIVLDDGTTSCLVENVFQMTTSTLHTTAVHAHMEFCLQCLWPDLRVFLSATTDQWAIICLSGPNSRKVLERIAVQADISNLSLPHLGVKEVMLAGIACRLFRISYSGELSYEINVPSSYAVSVWEALMRAGEPFDIMPFGAASMTVLRVEKGNVSSPEIDGRTTARDLGFGKLMSSKKEYIGRRMSQRPALQDPKRPSLVGFMVSDRKTRLYAGAQIVDQRHAPPPTKMLGYISSAVYSPEMKGWIGLGFIEGGLSCVGRTFYAASPVRHQVTQVDVVNPIFVDPEGVRMRG